MGSIQQLQPRVRELPVGGNSGQVLTKGADNSVAWETPVTSSYTAGEGISVAAGEISVTAATGTTLGGIKIGSGLTISNGFLSATGVSITIDSILSDDSVNPVQNLVITTALNGKANTAHTHEIAHVTNLQTSLNGKSNTGHTHTYSEIADPPAIPDIPTAVSAFTNDSGYLTTHQDISGKANVASTLAGYGITDAYTKAEVDTKVASVYKFQGSLSTFASLPASGNVVGDVYNVTDTGANYAWTGTEWDSLGIIVDLSVYATTTALNSGLLGKANSTHYHSASDVTSGQLALERIPTGTTDSTVSLGNHVHTATTTGNMGNVALRMGGDAVIVEAGNNVTVSSRYDSYDNEYFLTIAATDTTYSAATTTTAGLMSAADRVKLDGIQTGATAVSVSNLLTTGTAIGTITVNGTAYSLKAPTAEESVTYSNGTGLDLVDGVFSVTANTYAAYSHSHTTSDISDLSSTLIGYSTISHTHSYSEIANPPAFASVATSGSYNDLINTPDFMVTYSPEITSGVTLGTLWQNGASITLYAPTYTAGTGLSLTNNEFSVLDGAYASYSHTHDYSEISNSPTIPVVPTNISAFTNDAGYLTAHQDISGKADKATTLTGYGIADAYTKTEIDAKVASVYRFKGNVAAYANLPTSGQVTGDVYNVTDTGANYAWTGSEWDKLSETIDLTSYATTSALTTGLAGKAASSHTHEAGNITSGTLAIERIPTGTTASTVALGNHTHAYSAITGTPTLATVAETGSYNDLTDQPTIPTAYTLPTATSSVLGGVKVGTNLSIFDGTLSATNTTYNAATTTTAGLMSAADKTKLGGITASADAVSFSQTLTTGTAIGTITINGTGTTLYAPTGSGGSGGSNVTECNDSFSYYDGMSSSWHTSGCSPYPAELAHKAGFAYYAYTASEAGNAGYASTANEANHASTASYANEAGYVGCAGYAYSAGYASNACYASEAGTAYYASWAGPCYGIYTNNTGVTSYSTSSKAAVYESHPDATFDSTNYIKTVCPLPPIGPFIVDLLIVWSNRYNPREAKYVIRGSDLAITEVAEIAGSHYPNACVGVNTDFFTVSDSKLKINARYTVMEYNCCTGVCCSVTRTAAIITTAIVCGSLVGNIQ